MFRVDREKLKAYILLVLIITGLLQVGILLSYQNNGLPFNFLAAFFGMTGSSDKSNADSAREEYFVPYRMVLSSGDGSHWLIDKKDEAYSQIWDSSKEYIRNVLISKPVESKPAAEEWGREVVKRGVLIEFKSGIKLGLFKWFLNFPNTSAGDMDAVYKVMIVPGDGTMDNSSIVYITDGTTVYKYVTLFNTKEFNAESLENKLAALAKDKDYESRNYSVLKEIDKDGRLPFSYSPDILCVVAVPKYRSYRSISYSIPGIILSSDREEVARIILENEKYSYASSRDFDDTIVFNNQNNIYRIYKDGLLEYKYVSTPEGQEKDDIGAAFVNAYKFIDKLQKPLVSGASIYLSAVKAIGSSSGSYEFTFDYLVDDLAVVIDYKPGPKSEKSADNAIVIEANSRRVLSCRWIFKDFEQNNRADKYKVRLEEIDMNKLFEYSDIIVKDILPAYVVNSSEMKELVDPSWVIERNGGVNYIVAMRKEKGD